MKIHRKCDNFVEKKKIEKKKKVLRVKRHFEVKNPNFALYMFLLKVFFVLRNIFKKHFLFFCLRAFASFRLGFFAASERVKKSC